MDRDEVTAAPTKESSPKPEAVFKTEKIGQWQAKQDTPFEKQNREREKQKQRSKARNKKFLKVALWSGGAVVAVAAVIVTLMLTVWNKPAPEPPIEIAGNTVEAVNNYQDQLKEIYEASDNDMEKVQEAVNATLETEEGKKHADAVKAAQAIMQYGVGDAESAVVTAEQVNPSKLSLEVRKRFYDKLGNAYGRVGNIEKRDQYLFEGYLLAKELQGDAR